MELAVPKDVRCEIYNHITDSDNIERFLKEYLKTGDPELKLMFSCIREIYGDSNFIRKYYDLFFKLEKVDTYFKFQLNVDSECFKDITKCDYYKFKGRPLKVVNIDYIGNISFKNIRDVYLLFKQIFPSFDSITIWDKKLLTHLLRIVDNILDLRNVFIGENMELNLIPFLMKHGLQGFSGNDINFDELKLSYEIK